MSKDRSAIRHLAIIMDGTGRWAERRGLPRTEGHRAGAETVLEAAEGARELGIEYLTLYAFSTENWKRSPLEVNALMNLLAEFLDAKLPRMLEKGVRLRAIGRIDGLPAKVRNKLRAVIAATAAGTGGTLTLALNYGGRAEIADAARRIASDVKAGKITPGAVDEKLFGRYLYDPELPDPDLLIRTSGEMRISNFLLWELAYSELYVTDVLWPDFDREEMRRAAAAFGKRERRFGGRPGAATENNATQPTKGV